MTDPQTASGTDAIPDLLQLGERLRQARQAQGLSLDELADRLRIGADQLAALESGDRSRLREPVFVIAQAKRVAAVLGLDVEEQVAALRRSRLMQQTPKPLPTPLITAPPRPAAGPGTASAPAARENGPAADRSGPSLPVSLLTAGLAVAGALAIGQAAQRWQASPKPPLPAPAAATAPKPTAPITTAAATPTTTTKPPAAKPPAAAPVAPVAGAAELVLRTPEPSWVEVRDSAGKQLFEGTLSSEKRFPLGKGLKVMAGRPDLVTAAVGAKPARPLGTIETIDWQVFSPEAAPPAPAP